MRGGLLAARQARRLLRRPDVTVLHVYGLDPRVVTGLERDALTVRIEEFFVGCAPPMSDFAIAEFRNGQRQVMLVVQEYC
jgi:predicted naringenin-chalcone synthase